MPLIALDHVNIRTDRLADMVHFYGTVLGLQPGPRPTFSFNGQWLYCGNRAAIHLVEVAEAPKTGAPRIEHFAFQAEDLAAFLQVLQQAKVEHRIADVPGRDIRQVHLYDPDSNHVEVAFAADEAIETSAG